MIDELNRLSKEYLDKDELERNIEFCNNLREQRERLQTDITAYKKKIDEYSKGVRALYMDKVKGLLNESDYREMSKDFLQNRERLEHLVVRSEKEIAEIEEKMLIGDNRRELVEQYTNVTHLTREMVEILIDHITVGKRVKGEKYPPIEIHWIFKKQPLKRGSKCYQSEVVPEQKARLTYDNILRFTDDADVRDPIRFLRAREITHFQRFGDGLRIVQDNLDAKNFYAYNPAFDKG